MTDLDRQIAEAKGLWWDEKEGVVWFDPPVPINEHGIVDGGRCCVSIGDFRYTASDSKALELVDELGKEGWGCAIRSENGEWECALTDCYSGCWTGKGPTRPEAICRAWLAAITWMKERKA